jgi:hypothetical protein
MFGTLSVATLAMSLAKVAVVVSGEVGRSGICNIEDTALGYARVLREEFSVIIFHFNKEMSAV